MATYLSIPALGKQTISNYKLWRAQVLSVIHSALICPSVTMYRSVVGALHYLTWIKLYHACPVERTLLLHNIGHYDISRAP
jgi:hypothetical protein